MIISLKFGLGFLFHLFSVMFKHFITKIVNKYKFLFLVVIFFISYVFLLPPTILSSGSYSDSGVVISTSLLPTTGASMINSVSYDASAIPSGTSLKMQFSYDETSWYSATGVLDGWTTLSVGENTIDLSNMGWKKAFFYYKSLFISDGTETPVLNSVTVAYISFDGTFYTYSSSGTLTSINFLPTDGVSSINSFGYTLSLIHI